MASATYVFSSGTILSAEVNRDIGELNDRFLSAGTAHRHNEVDSAGLIKGGCHIDRSAVETTVGSAATTNWTQIKKWVWTPPDTVCLFLGARLVGTYKCGSVYGEQHTLGISIPKSKGITAGTAFITSQTPDYGQSLSYADFVVGLGNIGSNSFTTFAVDQESIIRPMQNSTIDLSLHTKTENNAGTVYFKDYYVEVYYAYPYISGTSSHIV